MAAVRGTQHKLAKLTDADVIAMRCLHTQGFSPYLLAKVFDVSRPHAKRIVRGEKWGWLDV